MARPSRPLLAFLLAALLVACFPREQPLRRTNPVPTVDPAALEQQQRAGSPLDAAPEPTPTERSDILVIPTPQVGPHEPSAADQAERALGLLPPSCTQSLQTQINAAAAGSTLYVDGCIYREEVTIGKALVLSGRYGAEIRGSDVWTGWSGSGPWTHTGLPALDPAAQDVQACQANTENRCNHPQQVFYDGVPLLQRDNGITPAVGQFSVSGGTVTLGSNPNGHLVEVSTRKHWVTISADNVVVQGFTMKHAANIVQDGAIRNRASKNQGSARGNNVTIQNNILSDAHGAVVTAAGTDTPGEYTSNVVVRNNEIARGGNVGIHGTNGQNHRFENNLIHDHNTELYVTGFEAGGIKVTVESGLIVRGNEIYNSAAPGFWCDIYCGTEASFHGIPSATAIEVSYNRIHDVAEAGIFYEISVGARIHHNVVYNSGHTNRGAAGNWLYGAGIFVSSSQNALVWENISAWNADGIGIISQPDNLRGGTCPSHVFACAPPGQATGHVVHNNWIFQDAWSGDTSDRLALGFNQDWGSPMFGTGAIPALDGYGGASTCTINNCAKNNSYYFPTAENAWARFACNAAATTLVAFNATACEQGAVYLTSGQANAMLTANGIPLTPNAPP